MSKAKTAIFSAIGAILGGVAGAAIGWYAQSSGDAIAHAMVVGGIVGAVDGAFLAGTMLASNLAGEPEPGSTPQLPQLRR
jgi:hypothetical protein